MTKLSDYVVDFIQQQGVKDIFLLPGGGCIHLVDSIGKSDLNYVCNLHEQACSVAADAYGQYTNNLGVCLVTTGPGGTNALTGVAAGWLDSTPMLIISGQVQKKDMINGRGTRQIGFQELDMPALVAPITKYAVSVTDPEEIKYHLEKAIFLAQDGRSGPVWIDIPLDVQAASIDVNKLKSFKPDAPAWTKVPKTTLKESVSQFINDLNKAKRPIILAGNGVRLSKSIDKFKEMCDYLHIPVLLTWKAIVDIDENEIKKLDMDIKYPLAFDCGEFIDELLRQKNKININSLNWLSQCKQWQAKYPVVTEEHFDSDEYIDNYAFIEMLAYLLPEDALIIPGSSGGCSEVTMQAFKIKKGQRMFNSEGLGPMGFGIPAAIGGCIAAGKKPTVCIDGDGGFIMNIQELEVVKRLNLPIKFFVLNNNGYVSIRNTQESHFNKHFVASGKSSGLTLPSLEKNAYAYDIPFTRFEQVDDLWDIGDVLGQEGPMICEVMLPETHVTAPKASVYKTDDGQFMARPMEDLAPFLDRDEFKENMIIDPVND